MIREQQFSLMGKNSDSISSGAHTATLDFANGVYVPTIGYFGEGLHVSGVPCFDRLLQTQILTIISILHHLILQMEY